MNFDDDVFILSIPNSIVSIIGDGSFDIGYIRISGMLSREHFIASVIDREEGDDYVSFTLYLLNFRVACFNIWMFFKEHNIDFSQIDFYYSDLNSYPPSDFNFPRHNNYEDDLAISFDMEDGSYTMAIVNDSFERVIIKDSFDTNKFLVVLDIIFNKYGDLIKRQYELSKQIVELSVI